MRPEGGSTPVPLISRFQATVARFLPPNLAPDSQEAFRLETIIAASLLVGSSGFPFMVLFFAIFSMRQRLNKMPKVSDLSIFLLKPLPKLIRTDSTLDFSDSWLDGFFPPSFFESSVEIRLTSTKVGSGKGHF